MLLSCSLTVSTHTGGVGWPHEYQELLIQSFTSSHIPVSAHLLETGAWMCLQAAAAQRSILPDKERQAAVQVSHFCAYLSLKSALVPLESVQLGCVLWHPDLFSIFTVNCGQL